MTNYSQHHSSPSIGVIVYLQDLDFASGDRLATETASTLRSLGINSDAVSTYIANHTATTTTTPENIAVNLYLCARELHQSTLERLQEQHAVTATFAAKTLQEALKHALQACHADYVLICCNGDLYSPHYLATVQQKLLAAPAPLDLIKGVVVDSTGTPLWPTTDATTQKQAPVTLITSISTCVFRRDYLLAHGLEDVITEWLLLYAARDPQIKMVFCPELKVEVNKHTFDATGMQRFHLLGATALKINQALQGTSLREEQRLYLIATVFSDVYLQLMRLPYLKDSLMYGEHMGKAFQQLSAQLSGKQDSVLAAPQGTAPALQAAATATQEADPATQRTASQLFLSQLRKLNPVLATTVERNDPNYLFPALNQQEQVQLQIRANEDEFKIAHLQTTLEKLGELLDRQTRGETASDPKVYVIVAMSNMPEFQAMWRDYFLHNPFLRDRPNIKLVQLLTEVNAEGTIDQGRVCNEFLQSFDLSEDAWLFFVQADYEILDDLGKIFALLDRNCFYSPHGHIRAKYRNHDYSLQINMHVLENRHNGSFNPGHNNIDLLWDKNRVEALEAVLAVHSSLLRRYPQLRFDAKLTIHLLIQDISINGQLNYGIESRALAINANHHCNHYYTSPPALIKSLAYLTDKYPDLYIPVLLGHFVGKKVTH